MTEAMKRVLDPCCGSRMFWFDRQHPDVVYGDRRHETLTVTDRSHGRADGQRTLHIEPDVLLDFRDLPYPDGSFSLVVFDPPHLVRAGPKSWLAAKYGKLGPEWRDDLRAGFAECFRVLADNGTLIFKWNETQVKVGDILALTEVAPLFGHPTGRKGLTHWIVFMKPLSAGAEGSGGGGLMIVHVISVSGGKDSAATLLIALERFGKHRVIPIFCDTGNEHEEVYTYLDYLESALDIKIVRLRANFDAEIDAKRMYVARDQRTRREYDTAPVFDAAGNPVPKRDGRGNIIMRKVRRNGQEVIEPAQKTRKVGGGRRVRWTNKAKRRAMAAMRPTGNPFLDLCIWKGRFPSRLAQFCTEELKRNMAVAFQLDLADSGKTVVSWQGVRRDESLNRRNAKLFERIGPGMYAYRPIVEWTAAQVFEFCGSRNLHPNPLYLQGMGRVGCMPCINANKEELRQIAVRFPEHIERISEWERIVGDCSKRGFSTLMADAHDAKDRRQIFADLNIWARVEWSRTSRGGRQLDMLADLIEPTACASAYGLCDQWQALGQQQEEARAA